MRINATMLWNQYLAKSIGKLSSTIFYYASEIFIIASFIYSCDTETTICLPSTNSTNPRAAYTCLCNLGYYVPNQTYQGFEGHIVETGNGNYSCIRCPNGCACDENGLCSTGELQELVLMEETLLHFSIGAVLGACMLCCMVLAAIVFRQRKCKVSETCINQFIWLK